MTLASNKEYMKRTKDKEKTTSEETLTIQIKINISPELLRLMRTKFLRPLVDFCRGWAL